MIDSRWKRFRLLSAGARIISLTCLSIAATPTNGLTLPTPQEIQNIASATADDPDSKLIAGLRIRRLFDLAERHCREILATPDLSPAREASFTIELIKTQTARAILSKASERESAWLQADRTATEFLSQNPRHPRSFLVRAQAALNHLSHGRLLRQELAAEMAAESARDKALSELRPARSLLNELQRDIAKAIPESRNRTLTEDELTTEELLTLNKNIRYQLAIANVNRAQLYAQDDKLNRIEALNQVLEALAGVQRETSQGQPLWWESRILQIECLRLLGKFEQAASVLQQLLDSVSDGPMPSSLLEQQLWLSMEMGNPQAAIQALRDAEKITDRGPQLEMSRLATVMELANQNAGNERQQWLAQAAQITRQIEKRHGDYWGRRAELMLINSNAANAISKSADPNSTNSPSTIAELDLLIRLADQAMRKQRWPDAVKAYDLAANTAMGMGDIDRSFTLTVRASQALERQNLHGQAADRLIDLANRHMDMESASAAHLRGCWNWARFAAEDPNQRNRFHELLDQHLERWPNSNSADQARLWLAAEHQKASQWKSAYENYVGVSPNNSLFVDAISRASYCANRWVEQTDPGNRNNVVTLVTDRLNSVWNSAPGSTVASFAALLALTEFGVQHGSVACDKLIEPLENLVAGSPQTEQQNRGTAWLLACLATDPEKVARADKLLAQIRDNPDLLEAAEKGLTAIVKNHAAAESSQFRQLRLQLIEYALATELTDRQRTVWLYRKSDALSSAGNHADALTVLNDLEQKLPRDAGIKLRIARLTTLEFVATKPEMAISKWRRLVLQLKPHTDGWYEAKFNIASLLEQSGKKSEAKALLEYMQAVPPGWEKSDLRDAFDELLKKCQ